MMVSNSTDSLDEIRSIYCPTVSKTTVWRALKANPFITRERMRKFPTLTADHKKARMDFARTHMSWTEAILPFSMCMCLFITSSILFRSSSATKRSSTLMVQMDLLPIGEI
uniref:HTH_Tnp_Tc3_2 domain-containing protein n=1 Tax=Heterorhabditis bacteriophora TaxID=37862 RepID=A0A1I7XMA5_HETBA